MTHFASWIKRRRPRKNADLQQQVLQEVRFSMTLRTHCKNRSYAFDNWKRTLDSILELSVRTKEPLEQIQLHYLEWIRKVTRLLVWLQSQSYTIIHTCKCKRSKEQKSVTYRNSVWKWEIKWASLIELWYKHPLILNILYFVSHFYNVLLYLFLSNVHPKVHRKHFLILYSNLNTFHDKNWTKTQVVTKGTIYLVKGMKSKRATWTSRKLQVRIEKNLRKST